MPESIVTNEDCMVMMARYPDKFFDLAIVDPPYGINVGGTSGKVGGDKAFGSGTIPPRRPLQGAVGFGTVGQNKMAAATVYNLFDDSEPPPREYFDELFRVSKNQIIWGGNYFIDHLRSTSCMIVWDKDNSGNFADCELAWTSFKTAVRMFTHRWNGMLQHDMSNKEKRFHPTQKPVRLYRWLLDQYAKPGDKILDTHLGSGPSRIAAHDRGFDFWGCELAPYFFDEQDKKFHDHRLQLKLNL